jgi:uncharacterized protein YjbI with pentapeptide repeats
VEADLSLTNLHGASFVDADLTRLEFHEAKFDQTDLRGATLTGWNLRTHDLRGAIITCQQFEALAHALGIQILSSGGDPASGRAGMRLTRRRPLQPSWRPAPGAGRGRG